MPGERLVDHPLIVDEALDPFGCHTHAHGIPLSSFEGVVVRGVVIGRIAAVDARQADHASAPAAHNQAARIVAHGKREAAEEVGAFDPPGVEADLVLLSGKFTAPGDAAHVGTLCDLDRTRGDPHLPFPAKRRRLPACERTAVEQLPPVGRIDGSGRGRSAQLSDECVGFVDLPQGRKNPRGIDRHGPGFRIVIGEIEHERLDVAVEDQADEFTTRIHDRAARIAPDDVCRGDEVEWRVEKGPVVLEFLTQPLPAWRKIEGGRLSLRGGPREESRIGGDRFDHAAILLVASNGAVGEPERERGVGIDVFPRAGKYRLRDLGMCLPLDFAGRLDGLPQRP